MNRTFRDSEFEDDDAFGLYEAACAGCDSFTRVDDTGLCCDCAGKFERDLIRERDWDYSALAFGVSPENREQLRLHIIQEHGEALELIEPIGKRNQEHAEPAAERKENKRRRRRQ